MSLTAVGFDLDYTLAVPDVDRATILREATDSVDAPPLSRESYLDAHARNLTEETREPIFADLLADHETDADPAAAARAYREGIAAALTPLPGVEAMLSSLRRDYRVGLLTNGPVLAQWDKLETLGWETAFDAVCVAGALPAGKPDERAYEALLDELDADAADVVYVGDERVADVEGATSVGLRVVQVVGPDDDPHPRADAHVDRDGIAATLPGLLRSF